MKKKVDFILILLTFFCVLIIGRLFSFQILDNEYWKALAQGQQRFFSEKEGERGEIYLSAHRSDLFPLAVNRGWEFAYLVPTEINKDEENVEEIAQKLSQILDLDKENIIERINKERSMYERLKSRLSPQEVEALKNEDIPGLYISQENVRYYPQENLASHVVGFLGGDNQGQYGVEGYFNDILKGLSSFEERDRLLGRSFSESQKGQDIVLTIDYNIQFMAEKMLRDASNTLNIDGGTILVGDPNTGRIIALANYPDFNPNNYSEEIDLKRFKNFSIQTIFEPGSIFKSITLAIALEEGKITPQTVYKDEGSVRIGGYTLRNYGRRVWGDQTMSEILEKSINTGAVHAQRLVGNEIFTDYLEKFEFFKPTGIELQGEVFSQNLSFKRGYEVNYANASFGQGIEVTSMQLFKAFSALANGGRIIDPYIIEGNSRVDQSRRVISPKTSSTITSMMVGVTEDGFAKTARVPGYYVAGKTGTAQVAWSALGVNKRGYSDKTIQSFIGYAPAIDPAFVMLVKLHNPSANTAEYSAAPIFGELAKYILDYYQIPPNRE